MEDKKLFMLLLGSKPPGRHTEQHDVFFCIGHSLASLREDIVAFWPEANGKLHVDGWREVTRVNGHEIRVVEHVESETTENNQGVKLFFINLGGYKKDEFEEFHYKLLAVAPNKGEAVQQALKTSFYLHTGFGQANAHVDDKYGVDVDDLYQIEDILPAAQKSRYRLAINAGTSRPEDPISLGYFKLDRL